MLTNKKPAEKLGRDRSPMIPEADINTAEKLYETFCAIPGEITHFEIKIGNLYFTYGKSYYYEYDVLRFDTNAFDEFDFDEEDRDKHPEDFTFEFVPKDGKFYEPEYLDEGCPVDWDPSGRVFNSFHECVEHFKTWLRKHGSLEEA